MTSFLQTLVGVVACIGICVVIAALMAALDWLQVNHNEIYKWWYVAAGIWIYGRIGLKGFTSYEPILPFVVFGILTIPITAHFLVWSELQSLHEEKEEPET
jgi:quinol-cytochrome oxidoreductase complex cytochrome b subunit